MNKPLRSQKQHASNQTLQIGQASHYFARLMTPTEVAEATAGQPLEVRQKTSGHWVLAGDISSEMFGFLKDATRQQFPIRLTGFSSSDGVAYCSFVHQTEQHQSRLVLPLYDASVRLFIESLSRFGKVTFSLGNDDGSRAILLPCPLKPNEFLPLLAMSSDATVQDQFEALRELPFILPVIGDPLLVPSLIKGVSVKHVSVSLLLPAILDEGFRSALVKAADV